MKRVFTIFLAVVLTAGVFAQSPEKMSYQSVIRDSENALVSDATIGIQISILQGTADGDVVYTETQSPETNSNGLLSIVIGDGETVDNFSAIDWSDGPYFIKTETDPEGGTNYTITGISQLLSVPYALHAKSAETLSGEISESQISDLTHFTSADETDPLYSASVAAGIGQADTTNWNNKTDFDGDFASLYNAPGLANSEDEKTIQLNSNDAASSLDIMNNSGTSVFKVDGSGNMTGDGSGLSNVKPLINYIGGNQNVQLTSNYSDYQNIRTVELTVPTSGVCFAMASGYLDWESTGWDLYLGSILCDEDPNTSWAAEDSWYAYLNIVTDYNCADSTDQYTSFAQHRCFNVSAGTHTFTLYANKYSSSSKTKLGDVNLSVMFFPTGGTAAASSFKGAAVLNSEEEIQQGTRPRSVTGE